MEDSTSPRQTKNKQQNNGVVAADGSNSFEKGNEDIVAPVTDYNPASNFNMQTKIIDGKGHTTDTTVFSRMKNSV